MGKKKNRKKRQEKKRSVPNLTGSRNIAWGKEPDGAQ